MATTIKTLGNNTTLETLIPTIKDIFSDLEDQLNQRAQIYVSTDGRIPTNLNRNDILVVAYKGNISFQVKSAKSFTRLTADMLGGLIANGTNYKGLVREARAPVVTDFPNPSDFGFFYKTNATAHFYLCYNLDGTLLKVELT